MGFHSTKKTSVTNSRSSSSSKKFEEKENEKKRSKKSEYQSFGTLYNFVDLIVSEYLVGADFRSCLITRIFNGLASYFFVCVCIPHSSQLEDARECELPRQENRKEPQKIPKKTIGSIRITKGQRTGLIFRIISFFLIIRYGWPAIFLFRLPICNRLLQKAINNFMLS